MANSQMIADVAKLKQLHGAMQSLIELHAPLRCPEQLDAIKALGRQVRELFSSDEWPTTKAWLSNKPANATEQGKSSGYGESSNSTDKKYTQLVIEKGKLEKPPKMNGNGNGTNQGDETKPKKQKKMAGVTGRVKTVDVTTAVVDGDGDEEEGEEVEAEGGGKQKNHDYFNIYAEEITSLPPPKKQTEQTLPIFEKGKDENTDKIRAAKWTKWSEKKTPVSVYKDSMAARNKHVKSHNESCDADDLKVVYSKESIDRKAAKFTEAGKRKKGDAYAKYQECSAIAAMITAARDGLSAFLMNSTDKPGLAALLVEIERVKEDVLKKIADEGWNTKYYDACIIDEKALKRINNALTLTLANKQPQPQPQKSKQQEEAQADEVTMEEEEEEKERKKNAEKQEETEEIVVGDEDEMDKMVKETPIPESITSTPNSTPSKKNKKKRTVSDLQDEEENLE